MPIVQVQQLPVYPHIAQEIWLRACTARVQSHCVRYTQQDVEQEQPEAELTRTPQEKPPEVEEQEQNLEHTMVLKEILGQVMQPHGLKDNP